MDYESENEETSKPPKPSLAPSWVMLGFLLGAATVWLMQRGKEPVAPAVALNVVPPAVRVAASPVTTIEAVFAEWEKYAVWEGNATEVAMWRPETKTFSEFYEVRRIGGEWYFRSIPKLTRRVVRSGSPLPADAPLQFTESEAHYQAWLAQGREEREVPSAAVPRAPAPAPLSLPKPDAKVPPLEQPKAELPPKS